MTRRTAALALVATVLAVASPASAADNVNRLAEPGAETAGLPGWTANGWTTGARGSADRFPPVSDPIADTQVGVEPGGANVFAATGEGATLSQTVDVADRATEIDAANAWMVLFGGFGGATDTTQTAGMTVQPLDAAGAATGPATTIGGPTVKDRGRRSVLVMCEGSARLPVGTRKLAVTVTAAGPAGPSLAMADQLRVSTTTGSPIFPAIAYPAAEGAGCRGRGFPVAQEAAKMQVDAATVERADRRLRLLAPISALASGDVAVRFQSAGRTETFSVPVDASDRRVRFERTITAAQARLGSGIVTLAYPGDADTRPQTVRLRAAALPARLIAERPTLRDGRVQASGTVTSRARGRVRLQLVYEPPNEAARTVEYSTPISNGRYAFDFQLSPAIRDGIALREGSLDSYTLFTGYLPARVRGEMESYQVLAP